MEEKKTEVRPTSGTHIMNLPPLPPPTTDTLKQEIINQYNQLMLASSSFLPLSLNSMNKADNGVKTQSRAIKRDQTKIVSSIDQNVEIQKALNVPPPLLEGRIALSDKYKCLRRKVKAAPTQNPGFNGNKSFHLQSNPSYIDTSCNTIIPPRIDRPLRAHNLGPYPNLKIHVDKPNQHPRNETHSDYWRRMALERAEQNRRAQEAAALISQTVATTVTDCQADRESKQERKKSNCSFIIPKMMKPTSGSDFQTTIPTRTTHSFSQHNPRSYLNSNIHADQHPRKETYREYRRRREMEEAEELRKAREAAASTVTERQADDDSW